MTDRVVVPVMTVQVRIPATVDRAIIPATMDREITPAAMDRAIIPAAMIGDLIPAMTVGILAQAETAGMSILVTAGIRVLHHLRLFRPPAPLCLAESAHVLLPGCADAKHYNRAAFSVPIAA